jgi:Kdo2-lipid IVA lauroyltransferase/acyltransferase
MGAMHQMERSSTVYMILKIFHLIPTGARKSVFEALFGLFYYISAKHRMITLYNLKCAFPDMDLKELKVIAKGAYRNLAIVAAEFFDIPYLDSENIKSMVEIEGLEHYQRACEKNKGVLTFGAHFGNWELGAVAVSLYIKPMVVIYRPLDSPILDELVKYVRSSTGNIPLATAHAMRPMIRSLRKNEMIGLLVDQNVAWQEGVFVDFFGRPACTTDGLALLARHTESAVIPSYLLRLDNGRYRLVFEKELELVHTGDRSSDAKINTQMITKKIEDVIRRYPDQWLWLHQRWKTKTCQAR